MNQLYNNFWVKVGSINIMRSTITIHESMNHFPRNL